MMNSSFAPELESFPTPSASTGYLSPGSLGVVFLLVILTVVTSKVAADAKAHRPWPAFPLVSFEKEKGLGPKESWLYHAVDLIKKGLKEHPDGFQVMQASGPRIILPNRFADEVKKLPQWTFTAWILREFFADYPGLIPFRSGAQSGDGGHLLMDTVRIKVTQSLNHVIEPVSKHASSTIEQMFGDSKEWRASPVKDDMTHLVAHTSALVFLGEDLATNEEWIKITKNYASDAQKAAKEMRKYPYVLLPILHWFLPYNKKVRQEVADAKRLIEPEIAKRGKAYREAITEGKKPTKLYDAIAWVLEIAKGEPVDIAEFQLSLSTVAINTTSEATGFALLCLCEHPEYIQELREEMIDVLGADGLDKNSLYKLKKLDSFLKESQRFNPTNWALMRRVAGTKHTLSNGVTIPKGASVCVSMERMYDAAIYPEPERFDGLRFYRRRQEEGQETAHQFAGIATDHLGFGFGEHACPGRFFATAEIKILLCHLLIKYDFRFPDGVARRIPEVKFETKHLVHPDNRILFRRREEEVAI